MYTFTVLGICLLLGVIWLKLWLYPDLMIVLGIAIIVFGYWWKWYVYGFSIASPQMQEKIQQLREIKQLGEKLTFNERTDLWILDGYGVKLCNKIGFTIILIGAIFLATSPIIK